MAAIFNGLAGFFRGGRAGAAEVAPVDAPSDSNEEQPSSPAQSVSERDSDPTRNSRHSSSAEHSPSQPQQTAPTASPTRPIQESRGPPPSYRSGDFFSQLPEDESDDGRLPEGLTPLEQRCSVLLMHRNSLPEYRFQAQVQHEQVRLVQKWTACHLKREYWLDGQPLAELATRIVRDRWQEQGIGNREWWFSPRIFQRGIWKHQKVRYDDAPKVVRQMDASRPFFQFMHDVAIERDHLEFLAYPPLLSPNLITHAPREDPEPTPDDLHTTAYYNVRYEQWVARGIWDYSWGALPGMFWRHETDIRVLFQEHFGSTEGIPDTPLSRSVPDKMGSRGRRIDTLSHFPDIVEHRLREWTKNNPNSPRFPQQPIRDEHSPSPAPKRVAGRSGAQDESLFTDPYPHQSRNVGAVPAAGPSEPLHGHAQREERRALPEGGLVGGDPRTDIFEDDLRSYALPKNRRFRVPLAPEESIFSRLPGRKAPAEGGLFGGAPQPSQGLFGPAKVEGRQRSPPRGGGLFGQTAQPGQELFGPAQVEERRASPPPPGGGLFGQTAQPVQGLFGPTEVEGRRASPSGGGLFGGTAQPGQGLFGPAKVEERRAPPSGGGLFGGTAQPGQGLFGPAQIEERQALPPGGGLFGPNSDAGQGFFRHAQSEYQRGLPPDGTLLRPFPPSHGLSRETTEPRQGPSAEDGLTRHGWWSGKARRVPSPSSFGVFEQESPLSVYNDENEEEDALDAIVRQYQAMQHFHQQMTDTEQVLADLLVKSSMRRPSARREPTRGAFSGETHQRRVLGPLPSSQRVSKRTWGNTTVIRPSEPSGSRAASVCSPATTVVLSPFSWPTQVEPGNPTAAAGSSTHDASTSFAATDNSPWNGGSVTSDDEMPRGQDFVIREDTQDVEEDVPMEEPMEEPRTGPTPRSRAKRRRRGSAERDASGPLRRSKRKTRTR